MRMKHTVLTARVMMAAIGCWVLPTARAADAPASQPAVVLDPAYIDGSFGFSVAPPAGGVTVKQKQFKGTAEIDLVQFSNELQRWSLTVNLSSTTQPLDLPGTTQAITSKIEEHYTDVQVLRGEETRIDAREAIRYAATFRHQDSGWLRQQAIIRTRSNEYIALVFVTPLDLRSWAEAVFDKVVASFQILRTEAMTKRIDEGLERGRLLLQTVGDAKVKLSDRVVPERFMSFVVDGKEVGYVKIMEQARSHAGRSGVEIAELAWLFRDDGGITHLRHTMYLTDDLKFENWENRVYALGAPDPQTRRQEMMFNLESGLRQDRRMIAAFMPKPNAEELQDRILEVDSRYASAAWFSLVPRVLDLKTPQLYAFSAYNPERRGMVLRTLEVLGPTEFTFEGRLIRATKLQDSEGLLPPVSEVDVDTKGNIIRVVAGSLQMIATSRSQLEAKFARRVTEAEATMKRYPIREPRPAPRDKDGGE